MRAAFGQEESFNPTPYQGSIYTFCIHIHTLIDLRFNPTPYQGSIYTN